MQQETKPVIHEAELTDIVSALFKRKREAAVVFFAVILVGSALYFILPKRFETEEILNIAATGGSYVESPEALRTIMNTVPVLEEIAALAGKDPRTIQNHFLIKGKTGDSFIIVRGWGKSPEESLRITKAVTKRIMQREVDLYRISRLQLGSKGFILNAESEKITKEIADRETRNVRLESEELFYQAEIARRTDAQTDAQGRIAETYIKLLFDARIERDRMIDEIKQFRQRQTVIEEERKLNELILSSQHGAPSIVVETNIGAVKSVGIDGIQFMIYLAVFGACVSGCWIFMREYHVDRAHKNI